MTTMHDDVRAAILAHLELPQCYVEFTEDGPILCGPFGARVGPMRIDEPTPQYRDDVVKLPRWPFRRRAA
jgi:hypothetical protein